MIDHELGAEAYLRRGCIYVNAFCLNQDGLRLARPPFLKCQAGDLAGIVGALRAALAASAPIVAEDTRGAADPLYALAGVRDWRTFSRSAKHVSVRQRRGMIVLVPWVNRGGPDPFQQDWDRKVVVPEDSEGLGAALFIAFDACD